MHAFNSVRSLNREHRQSPNEADRRVTRFGRFALDVEARTLCSEGQSLAIDERVMDVLISLINARGRIVPTNELLKGSSSSAPIANSSVLALVSQLRQVLGDDRVLVATVPRRGYRLATEWYEIYQGSKPPTPHIALSLQRSAPERPLVHTTQEAWPPLIGRDAELSELLICIPQYRLVTLLGPHGIGKSRLAYKAAQLAESLFGKNVYVVDLEGITLPEQILQRIARQVGVATFNLVNQLTRQPAFLVVDHCDQILHEAAGVIRELIASTEVSVMMCAESPLFVPDEHLLPLTGLRFALPDHPTGAPSDACKFFLTQLNITGEHKLLEPVCRALLGNPTAIQLAAQQIVADDHLTKTPQQAAALWFDHFQVAQRRRTCSYDLALSATDVVDAVIAHRFYALDPRGRETLRCISLYARPLTLANIYSVLSPGAKADKHAVLGLINSGLLSSDNEFLKVPPAVRRFAFRSIVHHHSYVTIAARHAQALYEDISRSELPFLFSPDLLDDLRRALSWSIEEGRLDIAARLLQRSADIWDATLLLEERLYWINRIIQAKDAISSLSMLERARLSLTFAQKLTSAQSSIQPIDLVGQWWRVYECGTACGDDKTRLLALSALLCQTLQYDYVKDGPVHSHMVRKRIVQECNESSTHRAFMHLLGILNTLDGRHDDAIKVLSAPLDQRRPDNDGGHTTRDQPVALSYASLAFSLWITGERTGWCSALQCALTEAREQSNPVSSCAALALACTLFMLDGNDTRLAEQARLLCNVSSRNDMQGWNDVGQAFLLWTNANDEKGDAARELIEHAIQNLSRQHATLIDLLTLERYTALAVHRIGSGLLLDLYDQMVTNLQIGGLRWLLPEALRVNAILLERIDVGNKYVEVALERAAEEACSQRAIRTIGKIDALKEHIQKA